MGLGGAGGDGMMELSAAPAKWLRGPVPLQTLDPLSVGFKFKSSFQMLDITSLMAAGDGS